MLGSTAHSWQSKRRESARQEILAAAWAVARENGLGALTLREVAARVGMRPPSLYSHFASKHAIYDAMFGQAWTDYLEVVEELEPALPAAPRAVLRTMARTFFDFSVADLARHQLINVRSIPGFAPSPEAYAPAVRVLEWLRARLADIDVHREDDVDLYTALVTGMIHQQLANDPGGDRWARQLDRAVNMLADELGLPDEEIR